MLQEMMPSGGSGGNDKAYMVYYYSSPTYFLTMFNTDNDVYCRAGSNTTTLPFENDYIKITATSLHAQTLQFKKACTVVHNNTGDVNVHYNAGDTYPYGAYAYQSLPLVVVFD